MRCAITGGSGFVGGFLATALTRRGDTVRCLVRPGNRPQNLSDLKVEYVEGDVTDAASLPALVRDCDVVFHLAGVRRGTTRDDFMRVNAEGTRLVGDAMVANGARRFVLCGSLAATGPSLEGRPRVERDEPNPQEWYGESKAEAERLAFSFAPKLEVTVSRPCRIVGPFDRENLQFAKLAKRGLVLDLKGAERRLSFVDVDDVVAHLLLLGERKEAVGEAFFCASDETRTVKQFMLEMTQRLQVTPKVVPVWPWALSLLAAGADVASNVTGKKLPLNRKLARQLLAPGWTCSIEKSRRLLGYAPTRSLADSLTRSLDSYLEAGWL